MSRKLSVVTVFLALLLCACTPDLPQYEPQSNTNNFSTAPSETEAGITTTYPTDIPTTEETYTETTTLTESISLHSPLYIEGLDVEDVIAYFNEVCLDAEFINSGDASLLQKWTEPIYYTVNGSPTVEDLNVLNDFTLWLNTINGFPGIYETNDHLKANLQIHFCSQQDMIALMGDNFTNMDGAVTFWYNNNAIYDEIICYRTDLNQTLRNSVILEEIYNGLGPIQDTSLRQDSIIYSGYSEPQQLSNVDELILKLLYNPLLRCGMNANECDTLIRQLYY